MSEQGTKPDDPPKGGKEDPKKTIPELTGDSTWTIDFANALEKDPKLANDPLVKAMLGALEKQGKTIEDMNTRDLKKIYDGKKQELLDELKKLDDVTFEIYKDEVDLTLLQRTVDIEKEKASRTEQAPRTNQSQTDGGTDHVHQPSSKNRATGKYLCGVCGIQFD